MTNALMASILIINSSPMGEKSVTRKMTEFAAKEIQAKNKNVKIIHRDLDSMNFGHLTGETIGAFYTPSDQRTEKQKTLTTLSDELIQEINNADIILLGMPLWNFSMPSSLKAYIDNIARNGVTFKYTDKGPIGLLKDGKKMIIVSSSGGVYEGDHSIIKANEQILSTFFGFIGIKDIKTVSIQGASMGPEASEKAQEKAKIELTKITSSI